jgi:signal transduction histidine kinase
VGALTFVAADSGRQYTPADVVTAQDLASRAAVAVDNARLHQQAQEAVRIRDDFLLAASHDLRTPLTSIKGYVQVIQMRLYSRKPLSRDWLDQQVQQLDDAVNRLAAAVEAMTDVAQLHIGHSLTLALEPVEIGSLVRSVAPGVAMAYNRGATPVEVDVAVEVVAMGDRVRLERVLQNIIGNAINYSPLGAAVQVRVERSGNWAVIEVQDRGIGIPAAELAHLFRRFYRASTSRGMKGTGIGLAGSKAIIEQHGGQISIASTLGSGTTVTIQLPLAGTHGAQELLAYTSRQR